MSASAWVSGRRNSLRARASYPSSREGCTIDATINIDRFLADEGFGGSSAAIGRLALEEAGVTRPGKTGFASVKLERAREALAATLARVCDRPQCRELLPDDGRRIVDVERPACEVCGGSNNQGAIRRMTAACRTARVRRVLVVGGTPNQWESLAGMVAGEALELRFVDGTGRSVTQRDALQDCAWADLVIVWAPTPLAHRVSQLYASDVCIADRVDVHRRGIEALADAVSDHLAATPGQRVPRR